MNEDGFPDDDISTPTDEQPRNSHHKLIEAYLTFLFMWQNLFRVSDVGMGVLLSFIALFVLLLGKSFGLESLKSLGSILPKSVYSARKLLGRNLDHFLKFVCCPKCSTLYEADKCILTNRDGTKVSVACSHVPFSKSSLSKVSTPLWNYSYEGGQNFRGNNLSLSTTVVLLF